MPSSFDDLPTSRDPGAPGDAGVGLPEADVTLDASSAYPATPEAGPDAQGARQLEPSDTRIASPSEAPLADAGPPSEAGAPNPPIDGGEDLNRDSGGVVDAGSCGDLLSEPEHCGACDLHCPAPAGGYASCRAGSCYGVTLARSGLSAVGTHGNPDGSATITNQLCSGDQVVTGLEVHYANESLYQYGVVFGLAVRCGRLKVSAEPSGVVAEIEPGDRPAFVGYGNGDGMGPSSVENLDCGPGEVATQVDMATWYYFGNNQGALYPTIKNVALSCSALQFDAQGKLQLVPSRRLTTPVDDEGNQVTWYQDPCGTDGAVVGFTGIAVANVDRLSTECSTLVMRSTPTPAVRGD